MKWRVKIKGIDEPFIVEAPTQEEANALAIDQARSAPPPPPSPPKRGGVPKALPEPNEDNLSFGDYASDVGWSALSGAEEGLTGLPGLGGDIEGLGRAGLNAASRYISGDQENLVDPEPQYLPTSEDTTNFARDTVKGLTGHDIHYTPQTTAGEYTKTAASFVPAAVLSGPGSVFKGGINMAKNAVKYGIAPGLTSEKLGQETEGTPLEPWARAAGALIAPAGVGAVTGAISKGKEILPAILRQPKGQSVVKKLKIIDEVIEKAKDDAMVMRGVGIGEALSKRMLELKRSKHWKKFTPEERHAINKQLKIGRLEQAAIASSPQTKLGIVAPVFGPIFGLPGQAGWTAAAIALGVEGVKTVTGAGRASKIRALRGTVAKGAPPPPLDIPGQSFVRGAERIDQSEHPIIERYGHKYQFDPEKQTYRLLLDSPALSGGE